MTENMAEEILEEVNSLYDDSLAQLEFRQVLEKVSKYCLSSLGSELIMRSLPTDNLFWLRKEHVFIDETISLLTEDDPMPFEGLRDIRPLLHKSLVANAVLSTKDLLRSSDVFRVSRMIKNYFETRLEKYPTLAEEGVLLHSNRLLEKHISEAIDEMGEVRDTASRELSRIRREIQSKSNHLRKRLSVLLKKVSEDDMVMEEFVTMREGRFVLPVKVEHKRHISGIIHGYSQTGSTVFMEPSEIFEMNNEVSLLINEEKREIYRILANLTAEIGDEARQFLASVNILANLDAVLAKAKYALEFGGVKPEIWDDKEIFLKDVRHPLLVHSKGIKKIRPMSISFDSKKRGHLISGPNAGGKTVALKSIGLNVTMALSGIFPLGICKTNYRTVFSAIGDHQSIENDLSTFSSQIIQLQNILSNCDNRALVLIDEILSGTDPQEGSALAAGIMDTFIELNLFFVATTHQSTLKSYALSREEIENASLEFDDGKLAPTYNFLQGIPGNSYAFVLAKSLGLSKLALDRAKSYLGNKQTELEESIAVLQRYRNEQKTLKDEARKEKIKAEKEREKYEKKFKEIKQKRRELIDKAKEEAYEIVQKSNALIENTIRQVQEEKKSFAEIKKSYNKEKNELEKEIKKKFVKEKVQKKEKVSSHEFKPGDSVALEDSNNVGYILEIYKDAKMALVEFNGVKFRLPFGQLFPTKAPVKPRSDHSDHFTFNAKSRLDIRGKRAEESLREVDEFLSKAIVSNLTPLTIIHGKGTGALKEAIHQFLRYHQSVKSFRLGTLVEGGAGVTVVEL